MSSRSAELAPLRRVSAPAAFTQIDEDSPIKPCVGTIAPGQVATPSSCQELDSSSSHRQSTSSSNHSRGPSASPGPELPSVALPRNGGTNSGATTEPMSPLGPRASSSLPSSGLPSVAPSWCDSSSHPATRCADPSNNVCSGCNDGDDRGACKKELVLGFLPEASPTASTSASSSTSPAKRTDNASRIYHDELACTSAGSSPSPSPSPVTKSDASITLDTTVFRQSEPSTPVTASSLAPFGSDDPLKHHDSVKYASDANSSWPLSEFMKPNDSSKNASENDLAAPPHAQPDTGDCGKPEESGKNIIKIPDSSKSISDVRCEGSEMFSGPAAANACSSQSGQSPAGCVERSPAWVNDAAHCTNSADDKSSPPLPVPSPPSDPAPKRPRPERLPVAMQDNHVGHEKAGTSSDCGSRAEKPAMSTLASENTTACGNTTVHVSQALALPIAALRHSSDVPAAPTCTSDPAAHKAPLTSQLNAPPSEDPLAGSSHSSLNRSAGSKPKPLDFDSNNPDKPVANESEALFPSLLVSKQKRLDSKEQRLGSKPKSDKLVTNESPNNSDKVGINRTVSKDHRVASKEKRTASKGQRRASKEQRRGSRKSFLDSDKQPLEFGAQLVPAVVQRRRSSCKMACNCGQAGCKDCGIYRRESELLNVTDTLSCFGSEMEEGCSCVPEAEGEFRKASVSTCAPSDYHRRVSGQSGVSRTTDRYSCRSSINSGFGCNRSPDSRNINSNTASPAQGSQAQSDATSPVDSSLLLPACPPDSSPQRMATDNPLPLADSAQVVEGQCMSNSGPPDQASQVSQPASRPTSRPASRPTSSPTSQPNSPSGSRPITPTSALRPMLSRIAERRPTLSRLVVPEKGGINPAQGRSSGRRSGSVPNLSVDISALSPRDMHRRSSVSVCSSVREQARRSSTFPAIQDQSSEDGEEGGPPPLLLGGGGGRHPSVPVVTASAVPASQAPRRLSLSVPPVPLSERKRRRWSTQNVPLLKSVGEDSIRAEAGECSASPSCAASPAEPGEQDVPKTTGKDTQRSGRKTIALFPVGQHTDDVLAALAMRMEQEVLKRHRSDGYSDSSGLSSSALDSESESDSDHESAKPSADESAKPSTVSRSRQTSIQLARDQAPVGACVPMPSRFSISRDASPRESAKCTQQESASASRRASANASSANASPCASDNASPSPSGGATPVSLRSAANSPRSGCATPRSGCATPRSGFRSGANTPLSPRSPRMSFHLPTEMSGSDRKSVESENAGLSLERDFHQGDTIGAGSFGRVFSARHRGSGMIIAVKEMLVDAKIDEEGQNRDRELKLCEQLRHSRVVRYFGHEFTSGLLGGISSGKLLLFLEYCSGGSVAQHLRTYGPLEEQLLAKYAQQLLEGLSYLHSLTPPVVHRDLKCANLLLTHDANVKIADFGCSKWLPQSGFEEGKHSMVGSVFWTAPEVLSGGGSLAVSSDLWSFGSCVLEMATAKHPWSEHLFDNIFQACRLIVYSDTLPEVPADLAACVQDVCYACLVREPDERPTASELSVFPLLVPEPECLQSAPLEPHDSPRRMFGIIGMRG